MRFDLKKISKVVNNQDELSDGYLVYILIYNGNPIVLGVGKKRRAEIIFDNGSGNPKIHFKAMLVRIYVKYAKGDFERRIIQCKSKEKALEIEKKLHNKYGGNTTEIPKKIEEDLFKNIKPNSLAYTLLRIALLSNYDGISDLKKWNKTNLIDEKTKKIIVKKLGISL